MIKLTWDQINTWRLVKQGIIKKESDLLKALSKNGSLQSQVASASFLALHARTNNLKQNDIESALWIDHSVIRTWAMRNTLHLIATRDLPLYVAANSFLHAYNWDKYFEYYGFSKKEHDTFINAIPQILGKEPITKEQLGESIAKKTGVKEFHEFIVSSNWGGPLKQSAHEGYVALGPQQGQYTTFINPRSFIKWKEIDPEYAARTVIKKFMEFNGPTDLEHFVRWYGGEFGKTKPKKVFESLRNELEEVSIDNWHGLMHKDYIDEIINMKHKNTIAFLPLFDIYTFGLIRNIDNLLPTEYKHLVFRPQGWISSVVLVNGYIKGVWEYKKKKNEIEIAIRMFEKPSNEIKRHIGAKIKDIGQFLEKNIVTVYI